MLMVIHPGAAEDFQVTAVLMPRLVIPVPWEMLTSPMLFGMNILLKVLVMADVHILLMMNSNGAADLLHIHWMLMYYGTRIKTYG